MYQIHHFFNFDRSLKVRWLAAEIGLPLQIRKMNPRAGEHLDQEFQAINPYGLIPTLTDSDTDKADDGTAAQPPILFENGAICLQLCRRHAPELIAEDDIEFMQWLFYFSSSLDPLAGGLAGLLAFGESAEARARIEAKLPRHLNAMESRLQGRDFWYEDKLSLLDFFAWQNLAYLFCDGQLSNYPALQRYVTLLAQRPALKSFEPEKLLYPQRAA